MSMNIEDRVKHVVAYQMGVVAGEIKPTDRFVEDMGADSLDEVELVMALEYEFELEIDDEKAEQVKTVQQAIDSITRELTAA